MWEARWTLGGKREAIAEGQSGSPRPHNVAAGAAKVCVLALPRGPSGNGARKRWGRR